MNNRLIQGSLRPLPSAAVIRIAQPSHGENAIPGAVIHASGRGIQVSMSEKLSSGTAVVIDVPEAQISGQVSMCVNDGRGFVAFITVEAVEPVTGDLSKLLYAVGSRDQLPVATVHSEQAALPVRVRPSNAG